MEWEKKHPNMPFESWLQRNNNVAQCLLHVEVDDWSAPPIISDRKKEKQPVYVALGWFICTPKTILQIPILPKCCLVNDYVTLVPSNISVMPHSLSSS